MSSKEFPHVIYLDTNALRAISFGSSNVKYLQLRDFANDMKILLKVPETVVLEWQNMQKEEVLDEIEKLKSGTRRISLLLGIEEKEFNAPRNWKKLLLKKLVKYLSDAGLSFVRLPRNMSVAKLTKMAIRKERPFKEKDEGFRDSVILLTIINDMKKSNHKSAILISEDSVFEHEDVKKRLDSEGLELIIAKNFDQAYEVLDKILDIKIDEYKKHKKQLLLDYVKSKENEIFKYIADNAQVSEDFVRGEGILIPKYEDKIYGRIDKILSIKPLNIKDVISSSISSILAGKDVKLPEGYKHITIDVEIEIELLQSPFLLWNKPKFSISSPEQFDQLKNSFPSVYGNPVETKVKRDLTIIASVKEEEKSYTDINIERILNY